MSRPKLTKRGLALGRSAGPPLEHAREGAERIRDIVRGLKTFSRPESEVLAALDVTHIMDASLAMVAHEIRHRARASRYAADIVLTGLISDRELGVSFVVPQPTIVFS